MASVMGVSSSLQALSLEVSRRVPMPISGALSSSSSSFLNSVDRGYFLGLPVSKSSAKRTIESLIKRECTEFHVHEFTRLPLPPGLKSSTLQNCAAVSSPNSVISEEAFNGLDLSPGSGLNLSNDYDYEDEIGDDVVVDSDDEKLDLSSLNLSQELVEALAKRGITHLFPIQRAVLVPALEGRDLIGRAKTGTGKTLAFGIPILERVIKDNKENKLLRQSRRLPRVLVLAPTRELAKQVEKEFKESAPFLSTVCIYGGVSYISQQNALARGVDVVVGTPGRIIDLVNSKSLKLNEVQFLVLDEADQMLAVGFEEDVEIILDNLPAARQSMLFSATMPAWVKKLSRKHLNNPMTIDLVGENEEKLAEGIKLYAVATTTSSNSKRSILGDLISVFAKGGKTIVFTQTKRDADDISLGLSSSIACEALHGDISQHQRERTLAGFREGKFSALVATDVAARGLDIPNVDLVIHYEFPNDPETFVHRSGRTGRAGKEGIAILMYPSNEKRKLRFLEREVGCRFEYIGPPQQEDVLESSAQHVAKALGGVHPELIEIFLPTANKLMEEKGTNALAAALARLSGFSKPPSSRSLITHEEGWTTLHMTRESTMLDGRRQLPARELMGILSEMWPAAADQVGKIRSYGDGKVEGAFFDLPKDVAKELLLKQSLPGYTVSKITQLPVMEDEEPPRDRRGRYSDRTASYRSFGGGRGRNTSSWSKKSFGDGESSGGWKSRKSYGEKSSSWMGRGSSRPFSMSDSNRSFRGSCFVCGQSGHRASDCPQK